MSNEETKNFRYLQIPLCWLQKIWQDPKDALEKAISYGIMYRAKRIPYTPEQVAKQLVYDFRRKGDLVKELRDAFQNLIDTNEIPDYKPRFLGNEFSPIEISEVVEALSNYNGFERLAIQSYQIHSAISANSLNLNIGCMKATLNRAKEVQTFQDGQELLFGTQPMPMISIGHAFKFRDNPDKIELLAAYTAIKSLIGQHNFTGTHRGIVVQRMIGAKSNAALSEALKIKILEETYRKYSQRYRFDKLIERLLEGNFLKSKIGYGRRGHNQGIYFSTKYDYAELVEAIDHKTRLKCHKSQEKKAQEELKRRCVTAPVTDKITDM